MLLRQIDKGFAMLRKTSGPVDIFESLDDGSREMTIPCAPACYSSWVFGLSFLGHNDMGRVLALIFRGLPDVHRCQETQGDKGSQRTRSSGLCTFMNCIPRQLFRNKDMALIQLIQKERFQIKSRPSAQSFHKQRCLAADDTRMSANPPVNKTPSTRSQDSKQVE